MIVSRRDRARRDLGLLVRAPIIVRLDENTVGVAQFQRRIHQPAGNRHAAEKQRGAASANQHPFTNVAAHDETADHTIVAREDVAARRNVRQPCGRAGRIEIVNLHHAHTGGVVHAFDYDGVWPRVEGCDQG